MAKVTTKDRYDVLIVGAGPAGATAGIVLAASGRRVALVDREHIPRQVSCAGWISARVEGLLTQIGVPTDALLNCPFRDVTFYRADFSKSSKPKSKEPFGYLVDRTRFDQALVKAAVTRGATLLDGRSVSETELRERAVVLSLGGGDSVTGRLLLVAAGRDTPLLERVGLERSDSGMWTVQVEAPLQGARKAAEPSVGVVLGLDQRGSFGLICQGAGRVSIGVHSFGERDAARQSLAGICELALKKEVVTLDLVGAAREARVLRSPASAALEMESHVGKHTLVIGDAGGFVAAASNEGVYPAMWSARIASAVLEKALSAARSQDELIAFDSAWRMEMADYLRSPHSDIQFLLPLIFTNQPMADRMGAAFFRGENI